MHKRSKQQRKRSLVLFSIFVVLLLLSAPVVIIAADITNVRDFQTLGQAETIDGPGFFAGNDIRIDGTVEGTTFATGQNVTVNGTINGDLFIAAQTLSIKGTIDGNIYCAGQNLWIGSTVARDVFSAGQNIVVEKEALIGRDLFAAGASIVQSGAIARDFNSGASSIKIDGRVGRNADISADLLKLGSSASIDGDLTYRSSQQADISPSSAIAGKTEWEYAEPTPEKMQRTPLMVFSRMLWSIAGALIVWLAIRLLWPAVWASAAGAINEKPLKTLGIGTLAFITGPIAAVLFMITVVGVPIGILLVLAYGVSIYAAKIVSAVFIGKWLAQRFGLRDIHKGLWLALLGLLIIEGLCVIPIVRVIVWLGATVAGLGAITTTVYRTGRNPQEAGKAIGPPVSD